MRRLLPETPPQRLARNAVDERALSVDLDYRQPLAILRLERGIAGDVDLVVLDALVVENATRLLAEVAARRRVQHDAGRPSQLRQVGYARRAELAWRRQL